MREDEEEEEEGEKKLGNKLSQKKDQANFFRHSKRKTNALEVFFRHSTFDYQEHKFIESNFDI